MIALSSRRLPLKLALLIGIAVPSAGSCEERPVNAAGYRTITLAEAGLSVMPAHAASTTETSPACARTVRRGGKTAQSNGDRRNASCGAANRSQPVPVPAD